MLYGYQLNMGTFASRTTEPYGLERWRCVDICVGKGQVGVYNGVRANPSQDIVATA
jgi:hypothetical protein